MKEQNLTLVLLLLHCSVLVTQGVYWQERLVYEEQFKGRRLSLNDWKVELDCQGYNFETVACEKETIKVRKGLLKVTPRFEIKNSSEELNFLALRMQQNRTGIKYGTFKVRARLPTGKNVGVTISIVPYTGIRTSCKYEEIKILSYKGQVENTLNIGAYYGSDRDMNSFVSKEFNRLLFLMDYAEEFHEYSVVWNKDEITWFIDDVKILSQKLNKELWKEGGEFNPPCVPQPEKYKPFSKPFVFLIEVVVGGKGFPPPDLNFNLTTQETMKWLQPAVEIDWLRVYKPFWKS